MSQQTKERLNFTHYRGLLGDFDTLKVVATKSGERGRIKVRKVEAVINTRDNVKTNKNRNVVIEMFGFKEDHIEIVIDNGTFANRVKTKANNREAIRKVMLQRNSEIGYAENDTQRKRGYSGLIKDLDQHNFSLLETLDSLIVSTQYEKNTDIIITMQSNSALNQLTRIQIKSDYLDIRKLSGREIITTYINGKSEVYTTESSNKKDLLVIMRRFICDCKAENITNYTKIHKLT